MIELFSVESRKGGVGKTTVALNLAKTLARKDFDVLLIDCDITGTPITKASWNSPFWKNHVSVLSNLDSSSRGETVNLMSYFKKVFLKGKSNDEKYKIRHETINGKINLIGSDIFDVNGNLIIDPRDLMDDLHSYWFLDMIKEISSNFCKESKSLHQAIVLDNSPGYVGIGKSIREWLTDSTITEKVKFVLVSSLDEQDIESTVSSAVDIQKMMNSVEKIENYVRVIINKVPQELLEEGSGYKFLLNSDEHTAQLIKALFPLDKKRYPKNIIKYDKAISGQFIEASLMPKEKGSGGIGKNLDSALSGLYRRITYLKDSKKKYSDVSYLSTSYHVLLNELFNAGYVRMSKTLALEEFLPETFLKRMSEQIGKLGNMAFSGANELFFSKSEIKARAYHELEEFITKYQLYQYYPIFLSLIQGLFKKAGIDRKDGSVFQLLNLYILIRAFYLEHEKSFINWSDYRSFLKESRKKSVKSKSFREKMAHALLEDFRVEMLYSYCNSLLYTHFSGFNKALTYTLLRLIDCERDYALVAGACADTITQGAKMMSEELVTYLKRVVYLKDSEPDDKLYSQLIRDPYEMKVVQKMISKYVVGK